MHACMLYCNAYRTACALQQQEQNIAAMRCSCLIDQYTAYSLTGTVRSCVISTLLRSHAR
jgi:hypothetical protein